MPIAMPKVDVKTQKLTVQLPDNWLQTIEDYCHEFWVKDIGDFLCQTGGYALKTDRDLVKVNRQKADSDAS